MEITKQQKDAWDVLYGALVDDEVVEAVNTLSELFLDATIVYDVPNKDGVYRERHNGVWGRVWVREDGEWSTPSGDGGEFGMYELVPFIEQPKPVTREDFVPMLRFADNNGLDIHSAIATFVNSREGNS